MPAGPLAWLATVLSVLAGAGTGTLFLAADSPAQPPSDPPVAPTPAEVPAERGNATYPDAVGCAMPMEAEPWPAPPPYHREFRGEVGPTTPFTAAFPVDDAWRADRLVVKVDAPDGPLARYRLLVDDAWGRTVARAEGAGALQAVMEDFPSGGTWRATLLQVTPAPPAVVTMDVTLSFAATPPSPPGEWVFYGPVVVLGGWGMELSFERGGPARGVEVLGGGEVRLLDSWGNEVARARGARVAFDVPADAGPRPYLQASTDPAAPQGFEVRVRTMQESLSSPAR